MLAFSSASGCGFRIHSPKRTRHSAAERHHSGLQRHDLALAQREAASVERRVDRSARTAAGVPAQPRRGRRRRTRWRCPDRCSNVCSCRPSLPSASQQKADAAKVVAPDFEDEDARGEPVVQRRDQLRQRLRADALGEHGFRERPDLGGGALAGRRDRARPRSRRSPRASTGAAGRRGCAPIRRRRACGRRTRGGAGRRDAP